jgi:hypothetical protein
LADSRFVLTVRGRTQQRARQVARRRDERAKVDCGVLGERLH